MAESRFDKFNRLRNHLPLLCNCVFDFASDFQTDDLASLPFWLKTASVTEALPGFAQVHLFASTLLSQLRRNCQKPFWRWDWTCNGISLKAAKVSRCHEGRSSVVCHLSGSCLVSSETTSLQVGATSSYFRSLNCLWSCYLLILHCWLGKWCFGKLALPSTLS